MGRQLRDTQSLHLPDGRRVELLRVRDPRARRLRLLVSSRGPRLTIPPGASAGEAQDFLSRHLNWLADQLAADPAAQHAPVPLAAGESRPFRLRGLPLTLERRVAPWLHVRLEEDRLVVGVPETSHPGAPRRAVHDFLVGQARADVGRWLPRYLPNLPRAPRSWRIRPLSSLWGSLSGSDAMSLDLALVLAPPAAFEYVLVHELCHLIHANHSRAFWHEVEQRCPQWRQQRRWLNAHGQSLKQELREVLG